MAQTVRDFFADCWAPLFIHWEHCTRILAGPRDFPAIVVQSSFDLPTYRLTGDAAIKNCVFNEALSSNSSDQDLILEAL